MKNLIKENMDLIVATLPPTAMGNNTKNAIIDNFMVGTISQLMQEKLAEGRKNGRFGWWDRDHFSDDELASRLNDADDDGDLLSVIIYTSMLLMREAIVVVDSYEVDDEECAHTLTGVYMGCDFSITLDSTDLTSQWYMRINPIGKDFICDGWIPENEASNAIDALIYACDGAMLPKPTPDEIHKAIEKCLSQQ